MEIQSGWVKPPVQIGGLDHLATQATCINLYGRYLPGITNVTDRARYYSFYPWIVWALEQAGHKYNDTFIEQFRRADCLFTLVAQRHAHMSDTDRDSHAAAMIGSANMAKPISEVKEGNPVRLSDYAHRDENRHRYFQSTLGGLGQYYLGVFSELNIMDGSSRSGVQNTNQIGSAIAESMDTHVDRSLFLKTIQEDSVPVNRLDELSEFCPCRLPSSTSEHGLLCDLFFVRGLFHDSDMLPRRRSLQTILHLADDLARSKVAIDLEQFRGCTYSGYLPSGEPWQVPERLINICKHWAVYQRNELLSMAVQGLFYALLDTYQESGHRVESVRDLCNWFLATPEIAIVGEILNLGGKVGDVVASSAFGLPGIGSFTNENHEVHLAQFVSTLCSQGKSAQKRALITLSSLKILLALKTRPETREGYDDIVFPGNYFQVYPINLKSFLVQCEQVWNDLTIREWIYWLCSAWGLNTHFKVALRKLRGQSQSTFRIRPSDQGLEVILPPEAVFTSPRFHQSFRILKDIGALEREKDYWVTSELGRQLKEFSDE